MSARSALFRLAVAAIVCSTIAAGCTQSERDRVKSELGNELQPGMLLEDIKSILVARHLLSPGEGVIDRASQWSNLSGKVPPDTPILVGGLFDDGGELTLTVYVILNDDLTFKDLIFDDVDPVL